MGITAPLKFPPALILDWCITRERVGEAPIFLNSKAQWEQKINNFFSWKTSISFVLNRRFAVREDPRSSDRRLGAGYDYYQCTDNSGLRKRVRRRPDGCKKVLRFSLAMFSLKKRYFNLISEVTRNCSERRVY